MTLDPLFDDRHLRDLAQWCAREGRSVVLLLAPGRYTPGAEVEARSGLFGIAMAQEPPKEHRRWTVVGVPVEDVRAYVGHRVLGLA